MQQLSAAFLLVWMHGECSNKAVAYKFIKCFFLEAECTRKRKEQELMQLFCESLSVENLHVLYISCAIRMYFSITLGQKLKVLRDLEARRRAQYEKGKALSINAV